MRDGFSAATKELASILHIARMREFRAPLRLSRRYGVMNALAHGRDPRKTGSAHKRVGDGEVAWDVLEVAMRFRESAQKLDIVGSEPVMCLLEPPELSHIGIRQPRVHVVAQSII